MGAKPGLARHVGGEPSLTRRRQFRLPDLQGSGGSTARTGTPAVPAKHRLVVADPDSRPGEVVILDAGANERDQLPRGLLVRHVEPDYAVTSPGAGPRANRERLGD